MRKLLLSIFLSLIAANSTYAQLNLSCGVPARTFDNVAIVDSSTGTVYGLFNNTASITWQISFGSAPSAISVSLQASLDNSAWSTIDTSTNTAGELRTKTNVSYRFIRGIVNSHTGGSGLIVTLNCAKTGPGGGGGGGSASFPLGAETTGCTAPFPYGFADDTGMGMCAAGTNDLMIAINENTTTSNAWVQFSGITANLSFWDAAGNRSGIIAGDGSLGLYADGPILQFGPVLGTGLLVGKGGSTDAVVRSIAAGAGIVVNNGDGQSGNPTVLLNTAETFLYSSNTNDPPATCTAAIQWHHETDTNELSWCEDTNTWVIVYPQGSGSLTDDTILNLGTTAGDTNAGIVWNTVQTPDAAMLLTGSTSNHIIIAERADDGFDFAHAASGNPTLYIHSTSQSTTQWLGFYYSSGSVYGGIRTGTGDIVIESAASGRANFTSGNALRLRSDGTIGFASSTNVLVANDAFWSREAAASIQQGADAATATAQVYKGSDSTGSGTAGGSLTLAAGNGTSGNAAGGDLILNGGNKAGTGVIGAVSIGGGLTGTNLKLDRTITGGGTTGAQTIDKISGTVNFAAAATTLVVTNALVTTSSIVYAVRRTNDTTCFLASVEPGAGSFTIRMTAACNAETSVGFLVTN